MSPFLLHARMLTNLICVGLVQATTFAVSLCVQWSYRFTVSSCMHWSYNFAVSSCVQCGSINYLSVGSVMQWSYHFTVSLCVQWSCHLRKHHCAAALPYLCLLQSSVISSVMVPQPWGVKWHITFVAKHSTGFIFCVLCFPVAQSLLLEIATVLILATFLLNYIRVMEVILMNKYLLPSSVTLTVLSSTVFSIILILGLLLPLYDSRYIKYNQ